jgi:bla regulator protein BlaR1
MTWLAANMAWASAMMLVVLAIRRPFAGAFGAGPTYALWLLPALRLVAPPLPASAAMPSLLPSDTLLVWAGEAAAPLPPQGGPGQWVPILLAIWALGAAAFLLWQALTYRRFLTELSLCTRSVGAHRGLPLIESSAVPGPLALGLLDRRIVVPRDFDSRYSPDERRLALDHEAVHHRRGDIWWNHVALAMLALHWFNPIAWFAFRAFRADQELACDARVIAASTANARHDYARALVKSASRPGLIAACPLNHADQLKRRLKMMNQHRSSRLRLIGGSAAIALLGGVGLTLGGPGFAHPHPETEAAGPARNERVIIRTERRGPEGAARDGERRHERVMVMSRDGAGGPGEHRVRVMGEDGEIHIPDCQGGQASNVDETTDGQRTRIVLCTRGESTPAQVERLQRVRDRLAADTELSEAQRARVAAALDRQIAQLRGN